MTTDAGAEFEVVEGYSRTAVHLDSLQSAADAHRNALGFYPRSVYEEFARGGLLYVLAKKTPSSVTYAGHLLFQCRYPRASVLQIFVLSEYRRHGKAGDLLDHLKRFLTQQGFISIYARVAEDLSEANEFWERQEFYVQRVEQGGATKNRKILVRSHELPSLQLFPASGISGTNPLGLSAPTPNDVPLFLLDLNVLFDVQPRRLRHKEVAALFRAERISACRLAISNEIREELKRTAHPGKTDPMEAYINVFPSFPLVAGEQTQALLHQLAELVFPGRTLIDTDISDLRHLATAIQHDLAGLITSDEALLAASPVIKEKFRVQVVSPAAFSMESASTGAGAAFDVSSDATLRLTLLRPDEEHAVRALLAKAGLSGSTIGAIWCTADAQVGSRWAVWKGSAVLGYMMWMDRLPGVETTVTRLLVDESDGQAPAAARILLMHLLDQSTSSGHIRISLEFPSKQNLVREVAIELGFRGALGQSQLTKLVLGRVVTQKNWESCRQLLSNYGGPKLPREAPHYRNVDQQIAIITPERNQVHVGLDLLETLLSPTIFCLPGRPAVITPIQRKYSEALLGHSRQTPLLPRGNVSTYQERHYLSSPRTLGHFKRGVLMLFYESKGNGGHGGVVALARIRQAYLKPLEDLAPDLHKSVLTKSNIDDIGQSEVKTIAVFDNIFHMPQPVPLSSLRRIGLGRSNALITTRSITDTQLQEILKEAFQDGS